jgi:integrase
MSFFRASTYDCGPGFRCRSIRVFIGKFAFVTSYGEDLHTIGLINKQSRKQLQRTGEEDSSQASWHVLWAADSRRFALMTRLGHPIQGVDVYFRSGETFRKIELPDLPQAGIPERLKHGSGAKAMSFAACAEAYINAHSAGWSKKSTGAWTATLETYAHPIVGALPVDAIATPLVLKILQPIWTSKVETASRLRGRIEAVLDWAKVSGYRDGENPARWDGHLENLLPAKAKIAKVKHHAALPYSQLPVFIAKLRQAPELCSRALEFVILTAARTSEALGARWEEIDLAAKVWTVPASRMKLRREHRVPLSDAAVQLLGTLPGPHEGLVFPGDPGKPLSKMALPRVLDRLGLSNETVHGFRSTFRDFADECTNYPDKIVEQALAHLVGNAVSRAYRRNDAFVRRARLMQEWADFCAGKSAPAAEA